VKKHIYIAGIEVRTNTVVITVALLLFIAAMLIARAVRAPAPAPAPTEEPPTAAPTVEPTEEPTPTPVPPSPTPEPTEEPEKEIEVVGEWTAAPGLAGGVFLGPCHGFSGVFTRLEDPELVTVAGEAYPEAPDVPGLVAMGTALYIPRTGDNAGTDVDAWLQAPDTDCDDSPWSDEAVEAFLAAQEEQKTVAFFGIARPVVKDGTEWEVIFYAVVEQ